MLPRVTASPEQLPLISQNRFGIEVICGAAGSGKTSTALLRLRSLCYMFSARKKRTGGGPVKVLVLTFNRTLAGYVRALAEEQIDIDEDIELEIETFGRWAMSTLGYPRLADDNGKAFLGSLIAKLCATIPLISRYLFKEVDYLLGRFPYEDLERYITVERTGRGPLPRVLRPLRRRILDEVIVPYLTWLSENSLADWNGVAIEMARNVTSIGYDIVIVDESQDFSANQLRAIKHHLALNHAVTFVIDTAQRIYARGFTWVEAGFDVRPERFHMLKANHRNTRQIAAFAASVLEGVGIEGDGALPDLNAATSSGSIPIVIQGLYSKQLAYCLEYIHNNVKLELDSVAFLKPKAGKWFGAVKDALQKKGIAFVDVTREAEWPSGDENVALSTFHSAKGLEFDYVFIIGLNDENTQYDDAEIDDEVFVLRRLLAVAIARARKAVVVGYKPNEVSDLVEFFSTNTFETVVL